MIVIIIPAIIILASGQLEQQEWLTFENKKLGLSIQYPAELVEDIEETEYNDDEIDDKGEIEFITSEGSILTINIGKVGQYLDTESLTLKTGSAYDYLAAEDLLHIKQNQKNEAEQEEYPIEYKKIREMQTIVNGLPAARLDYTLTFTGIETYVIKVFLVSEDTVYIFEYVEDPLKVPETLPLFQRMTDSFQITN